MRRLWSVLKKVLIALLILLIVGGLAAGWSYKTYVVDNPGEHLEKQRIQALIAQESPVLYRDGETPIGVFFADDHRIYVEYEDIPQCWVDAITSAEDQRFFEHPGVDGVGLARAMTQNIKAGRLVSGGSTLTMQTSENLFHPGTRDLHGKLYEVVDALRLEAHYEKSDILEFYANQFHVHGNGRGLGIAARYFFDKDLNSDAPQDELTLQECAFLAGMVKGPGNYNPFLAKDDEQRAAKETRALKRANYVLERMYIDGKISKEELDQWFDHPMAFSEGTFRYDSSVLLDEVAAQLEQAPFPEILAEAGIDNPATSGIRIVTTLDADAQRAATYGLWHHLSEAGSSLEGAKVEDFIRAKAVGPSPDADAPQVRDFVEAKVSAVDDGGVDLLLPGGVKGRLDKEALQRAADILALGAQGKKGATGSAELRESVRKRLTPGTVVWVSVRSAGEPMLCDLERTPELQGAVVVLEDGAVRALVGGNDNRNFNRAVSAKRQLGSTWKILVFNAALQLGWAPTDVLDNRRGVFPFTGTWYYPRPDHRSEDFVSLNWAGVRSENLASIWLLYHLTDRLNPEQLRRVAEITGLAQQRGESRQDYIARIRDEHGVIATRSRLSESWFGAVKEEVISGLEFSGHPEDAAELRSLHYGRGFSEELSRVSGDAVKEAALRQNFLHLESQLLVCEQQLHAIETVPADEPEPTVPALRDRLLEGLGLEQPEEAPAPEPTPKVDPADVDLLWASLGPGGIHLACGTQAPSESWQPLGEKLIFELGNPELPRLDTDLLIDGRLHASTLHSMRGAMDRLAEQHKETDPYDPELLLMHPDFKLLLGMEYVAKLAQVYGVQEELPPVLSMPLGALDISLLEAANVYQGYLAGQAWTYPGKAYSGTTSELLGGQAVPPQQVPGLLIAEIRDREGNLIYQAEPEPVPVADPVAGRLTVDILRNVVSHGTGRRALRVAGDFPLGGKTGTTNDFRNAAFIGHAPIADAKGRLVPDSAYTVAVYVGYDDNRQMVRNNIKLAGASGALPAWMGTVQGLQASGLMGKVQFQEELEDGYARVPVVDYSGLATGDLVDGAESSTGGDRSVLVYGAPGALKRRFAPLTDRPQVSDDSATAWEGSPWRDPEPEVPELPPQDTGLRARIAPEVVPEVPDEPAPSVWDELQPAD